MKRHNINLSQKLSIQVYTFSRDSSIPRNSEWRGISKLNHQHRLKICKCADPGVIPGVIPETADRVIPGTAIYSNVWFEVGLITSNQTLL